MIKSFNSQKKNHDLLEKTVKKFQNSRNDYFHEIREIKINYERVF